MLLQTLVLAMVVLAGAAQTTPPHVFAYTHPGGILPLAPAPSAPPGTHYLTAGDALRIDATVFGLLCTAVTAPNATDCPAAGLADGTCTVTIAASLPPSTSALTLSSGVAAHSAVVTFPTVGTAHVNASIVRCSAGVLSSASSDADPAYAVVRTVGVRPRPSATVAASPAQLTAGAPLALSAAALAGGSPPYTVKWLLGPWSGPGEPLPNADPRTLAVATDLPGPSASAAALVVPDDLPSPGSAPLSTVISLTVRNAEGGLATGISTPSPIRIVPPLNASLTLHSPALTASASLALTLTKAPGGGTGPSFAIDLRLVDTATSAVAASVAATASTSGPSELLAFSASLTLTLPYSGAFALAAYVTDSSNVTTGPFSVANSSAALVAAPQPLLAFALLPAPTSVSANASATLSLVPGTGSPPFGLAYTLTRDADSAVLASGLRTVASSATPLSFSTTNIPPSWLAPGPAPPAPTPLTLTGTCVDAAGVAAAPLAASFVVAPPPLLTLTPPASASTTASATLALAYALSGGTPPFVLTPRLGATPLAARVLALPLPPTLDVALTLPPSLDPPLNATLCVSLVDAAGATHDVCLPNPLTINALPTAAVAAAPAALTLTSPTTLTVAGVTGGAAPFGAYTFYLSSSPTWVSAAESTTAAVAPPSPLSTAVAVPTLAGVLYAYVDAVDAAGVASLLPSTPGFALTVAARPIVPADTLSASPLFVPPNATLDLRAGPVVGGTGACASVAFALVDAAPPHAPVATLGSAESCGGAAAQLSVRVDPGLHPAAVLVSVLATDATGVSGEAATHSTAVVVLLPPPSPPAAPLSLLGLSVFVFASSVAGLLLALCLLCALVVWWTRRDARHAKSDDDEERAPQPVARHALPSSPSSSLSSDAVTVGFESSTLDSGTATADLDELFERADGAINVARERVKFEEATGGLASLPTASTRY